MEIGLVCGGVGIFPVILTQRITDLSSSLTVGQNGSFTAIKAGGM